MRMKNGEHQKMFEKLAEIHTDIAVVKEQIKGISSFQEDYKNGKFINIGCEKRFNWIESKIWLATGGLSAISLIALTKSIGLW